MHFVDLDERPAAKGELRRFAERFGPAALIDKEGARYKALGLRVAGDSPQRLLDRALTEPRLLRTPLVRNGGKVTVGAAPDDWQAVGGRRAVGMTPLPFALNVSDAVLADLRARLERVRWPDEAPAAGWQHGTSLAYMKELVAYWRDRYDWRAHEARLNRLKQFTAPVGGIDLHFIHEPGVGPAPLPLLLSHGWPGSIVEFERILPMLTDPARFGGDPADAFTVVAPSLPGYTFSFQPGQPRFGVVEIADLFASLMTDVLGYRRFAAQGGDWGAFVVLLPRRGLSGAAGRHSREPARGAARSVAAGRADRRGEGVSRRARLLAARGDRLPADPGDEAPDARLRPHRLAGGTGRLDRGEVPHVERLRR